MHFLIVTNQMSKTDLFFQNIMVVFYQIFPFRNLIWMIGIVRNTKINFPYWRFVLALTLDAREWLVFYDHFPNCTFQRYLRPSSMVLFFLREILKVVVPGAKSGHCMNLRDNAFCVLTAIVVVIVVHWETLSTICKIAQLLHARPILLILNH